MNFRDIIFSSGKKQTTITAYSTEHRTAIKEQAKRDIKWAGVTPARDRTLRR